MAVETSTIKDMARQFRTDGIRMAHKASSGHPTSSMSAADLMAVLLANHLRYDFDNPENPANDHLIFSKGHASTLLYSMYKAAGAVSDDDIMTYREKGSLFEGHPTPRLKWVDVATGSLGQGLPIGVGVALAGKYLDKLPYRVWVLCGDSEMAEGSMWEAFEHASYYQLDNLIAILDMNRLGQRGETMHGWDGDAYARRAEAFGWRTIQIDGHDTEAIDDAYTRALESDGQPVLIVARTKKGKGVSFMEDVNGFHGKPTDDDQTEKALEELGGTVTGVRVDVAEPPSGSPALSTDRGTPSLPEYGEDDQVPTRRAYGDALKALGDAYKDVVVLDGEVSNSTYSEVFRDAHEDRFFEMFIAEQQMVAAAVGLQVRNYTTFSSTFAAFLSRAYDFVRMAAVSRADLRLSGSHAGVSIGEDGPSQMGLEDLAMMRAIPGSTVLYPSDPNQTAKLVARMADQPGISYIRTTRSAKPTIYSADEEFPIGGSKVLRQSDDDSVTIVAAGITVHEALAAHEQLQSDGINARVIDLYSVKPVDVATLKEALAETDNRLIVVEDHWPEGGVGSAIVEALSRHSGGEEVTVRMEHLSPTELAGSATGAEQIEIAGISASHIVDVARSLVG
ncbi:MAG: transketolase [Thermomicrobiales bacterium]